MKVNLSGWGQQQWASGDEAGDAACTCCLSQCVSWCHRTDCNCLLQEEQDHTSNSLGQKSLSCSTMTRITRLIPWLGMWLFPLRGVISTFGHHTVNGVVSPGTAVSCRVWRLFGKILVVGKESTCKAVQKSFQNFPKKQQQI